MFLLNKHLIGKRHPTTCDEAQRGGRNIALTIHNLDGIMRNVVTAKPQPFYPRKRDPVPIIQEA
jgi:hypothetical protein